MLQIPRQHCTKSPDIAQEESWANIEQKDKIVRNTYFNTYSTRLTCEGKVNSQFVVNSLFIINKQSVLNLLISITRSVSVFVYFVASTEPSSIWFLSNYSLEKQPPKVFYKTKVLKNFAKFTENACVGVSLACNVTILKKRLQHRCFPVNSTKFLRTPFLKNTYGRLFLPLWKTVKRLYLPSAWYVSIFAEIKFLIIDSTRQFL